MLMNTQMHCPCLFWIVLHTSEVECMTDVELGNTQTYQLALALSNSHRWYYNKQR